MTTLPEPVALQFWSHQEITPEIRAQIEGILEGGDAECAAPVTQTRNGDGTTTTAQPTIPGLPQQSNAAPTSEPERAADNPNIKQTPQGIWVLVNDSHISRWVEEHGSLYHDKQTLPKVLPEIPVGGVVVDVGANIGDSTAPFLERVGEHGKVIAFEPNPDAFECLKRNCPRAVCHSFALGDSISLLGLAQNENAGARHLQVADAHETTVNIGTLDALELDRLDFLKIDVEGFELRVLKGAEQTINRFRPKMLIEVNKGALERQGACPVELFRWIQNRGYGFKIMQEDCSLMSPQFDILCRYAVPPESVMPILPPPDPRAQGIDTIQDLAERLKKFCGSSAQTRAVRLELHRQGIIELPYRFKRRKKWRKRKAKA